MPTNWHLALISLSITNKCYAISTNYKKNAFNTLKEYVNFFM